MRRLLWFRRDLRVDDNPLLELGGEVLPVFIFDTNILDPLERTDRRVRMIYAMVSDLKRGLRKIGLDLFVYHGDPVQIIGNLQKKFGFGEVCASGDYDAYALERDRRVSHLLPFNRLHDPYIFRPEEMLKKDGTPYLIFTPFYKAAKARFGTEQLYEYTPVPQTLLPCDAKMPSLATLGFEGEARLPEPPDVLLERFAPKLPAYGVQRDRLDLDATSHLSVALRFGTISVRAVLRWLFERRRERIETEPFFRQLLFRDFYAHLLFHFPDLAWKNFRYGWGGKEDREKHALFCAGRTGVPVVDAGVRELLATGNMHNRARMVCASFYTKDLLLPWQWGERFFAAHLNDYDAASNILSWQWSAGTGVDPQPWFRIFNPWLQAKKFDPDARYIKRYLPELASLEPKQIHDEAWLLTHDVPGYPHPVVVHKTAAESALAYFKSHT
ncbi:MAG: deoxyribodipyrimidine photo-lyase [Campylobacterales bacterium]|jgi:deoxyribodipyrimidine photo-lyase